MQAKQSENLKKVLVINDETDTNMLISAALKQEGYLIEKSPGLLEGKLMCANFKPDLLFLDINLPDGNGLNNISYFKSSIPGVKICMISADEEVKKAGEFRADAFLYKPFSLAQIIAKAKELIG